MIRRVSGGAAGRAATCGGPEVGSTRLPVARPDVRLTDGEHGYALDPGASARVPADSPVSRAELLRSRPGRERVEPRVPPAGGESEQRGVARPTANDASPGQTSKERPAAVLCQGAARIAGRVIHAEGCPVVLQPGDETRASHGLSKQCRQAYLRWAKEMRA